MLDEILNGLEILRDCSGIIPVSFKTEGELGLLCFDLQHLQLSPTNLQRLSDQGWLVYKEYLSYPLLLETEE